MFADHLIGHLMWPLIAVIALVAFYPVIRERIAVLERLKVGPSGLEGEFGGVLEKSDRTMAAATVPRHRQTSSRTTSASSASRRSHREPRCWRRSRWSTTRSSSA
jgi:hypothetical protein